MTALLLLHLLAAVLAPALVRFWGRQAFLGLALVPAAAFGWVLAQLATITGGDEVRETSAWVPAIVVVQGRQSPHPGVPSERH